MPIKDYIIYDSFSTFVFVFLFFNLNSEMNMPKPIIFLFSLVLISNSLFAQNFEIGLTLGFNSYSGDIDVANSQILPSSRPAIGLVGKYRLTDNFVLRGHVLRGKLGASEKNHPETWRQQRGFSFTSKMTELAAVLEWTFYTKGNWTAYAFGGLGATFFNPNTDYNEPNPYVYSDINVDSKANYKKVTPIIPLGFGLKYQLPRNFNVSLDIGYRKTFTDYLDGISKLGNPKRPDGYVFSGLTLTKAFGGGKNAANRGFKQGSGDCPKF